jgi:hypothetical protein
MCNPVPKGRSLSILLGAFLSIFLFVIPAAARAQNNLPLNVQGRVLTNGVAFNGVGNFKFALVQGIGGPILWTHDGESAGPGSQPTNSVSLNVVKGLYSVMLGDTTIPGMTNPINPDIFTNTDVRLRVWFDDGAHGFQQLAPDQRIAAVGYAFKSSRADVAAVLTGPVTIQQVPSILITNNATEVNLTGTFTGDGSGLIGIRGSTPFQVVNLETNVAFPNTGYLITNPVQRVVLLPATASMRVGDIVRIAGPGSWKVAQNSDQSIFASHFRGGVGATWVARDSARNWKGIASSTNGVNLFALDAGKLIYLSTNGGVTWLPPQVSPQKNWTVAASSADGQRLIAGTANDYLFMSTDSGQNWGQRIAPGQRLWAGVASSLNGSNLVAVANGPAYTSNDAGETWSLRSNAGTHNWTSVASSSDGTNIVAGSLEGVYISKSQGLNWAAAGLTKQIVAVACSYDFQRIIAAANDGSFSMIYTSSDGGANWVRRDASGSKGWIDVKCSADGSIIAATANDGVSISVDAGGAWTVQGGAKAWQRLVCSPDGTSFAATVLGGNIYTSEATTLRSTTPGVNGYLAGGEYSAVELQHAGGGQFFPLSSSGQIFAY